MHGGAAHVHACELNPHSVAALGASLSANGVEQRCTVYAGDNRDPKMALETKLAGLADRVNLGLLPSSEDGYPLAVRALKAKGGWLHGLAQLCSLFDLSLIG